MRTKILTIFILATTHLATAQFREISMHNGVENLSPDTTYFFYDSGGHDFSGGQANNYQPNEDLTLIFKVPNGYKLPVLSSRRLPSDTYETLNQLFDITQGDYLRVNPGRNNTFTCDVDQNNISNDPGNGLIITDTFHFVSNADNTVGKGWYIEINIVRDERTTFNFTALSNNAMIYYDDTILNTPPYKLKWESIPGCIGYQVYLKAINRVINYNTFNRPITSFENMTDNKLCFLQESTAPFFANINEFDVPTSTSNNLCNAFEAGDDLSAPMNMYWSVKAVFPDGSVSALNYSKFTIQKRDTLTTSINDIEDKYLEVYPNPSNDNVILNNTKGSALGVIVMVDLQGRTVYNQLINSDKTIINVSSFNKGIYQLIVTEKNGRRITKRISVH